MIRIGCKERIFTGWLQYYFGVITFCGMRFFCIISLAFFVPHKLRLNRRTKVVPACNKTTRFPVF